MNGTEEELQLSLDETPPEETPGDETPPIVAQPEAPAWTGELVDTLRSLRDQRQPEPTAPAAAPQMSAQELAQLNERLAGEILTNPLGVIAPIAQRMAQEQVDALRREAGSAAERGSLLLCGGRVRGPL